MNCAIPGQVEGQAEAHQTYPSTVRLEGALRQALMIGAAAHEDVSPEILGDIFRAIARANKNPGACAPGLKDL